MKPPVNQSNIQIYRLFLIWACLAWAALTGCAMTKPVPPPKAGFPAGTIVSSETKAPVTFEALMDTLLSVDAVYVGERHTSTRDHDIQLKVLKALYAVKPDLCVGMEMFDTTYQPVLDEWSAGKLSEEEFLEKTHWRANWRFDFSLYRPILEFIRDNRIRLFALNLPFNIPPKILAGGVDSLTPFDRQFLPEIRSPEDPDHRAYVQEAFSHHPFHKKQRFEYFYEAQCAWEDTMAENTAKGLESGPILVLCGNGHIFRRFGVPERARRISGKPYRTVRPVPENREAEIGSADFLWITGDTGRR